MLYHQFSQKLMWRFGNYESQEDDEDCSNIRKWWSKHKGALVLLEQLAREVLSIPASSSSSERSFSAGTRACSAKRHNIFPKRISDLMILIVNEEDVENYREKYGIKKLFEEEIMKLVDVEFVSDRSDLKRNTLLMHVTEIKIQGCDHGTSGER